MKSILKFLLLAGTLGMLSAVLNESLLARPHDRFEGPEPGEMAPLFTLKTVEGKGVSLKSLRGKPVALILGSYTCPVFRRKTGASEKLIETYGDRIAFYYLYTIEAHPSGSESPYRPGRENVGEANRRQNILRSQPVTWEKRKDLASECVRALSLSAPVLVDELDNAVWKAYGSAPNAAYLIDANGKVAARHGWFDPTTFENSIQDYLNSAR